MNNNKGLWTVLIIIVVILIIWGIVAAYNHNGVAPADQGLNATSSTGVNGGYSSGSNGGSNTGTSATNKNSPVIDSLSPVSGRAGILVTVNGRNFTSSNNKISFGGLVVSDGVSHDGSHMSFTVPDSYRSCVGGNCSNVISPVDPGIYPVAVTNANGTSNIANFTITQASNSQ